MIAANHCNILPISNLLHISLEARPRLGSSKPLQALKRHQNGGLERLERVCRDRGIPVTVQRRVIFTALLERETIQASIRFSMT